MRVLAVLVLASLLGCQSDELHLAMDEAGPLAVEGDASLGEAVFVQREQGHCVLCHQVASLDAPFQGNIGPTLSDVGRRLTPAQIRFRIIDASKLNPATTMPPYSRVEDLNQVATEYRGKPVLSGQQIEHLVAYLAEQKGNRQQ